MPRCGVRYADEMLHCVVRSTARKPLDSETGVGAISIEGAIKTLPKRVIILFKKLRKIRQPRIYPLSIHTTSELRP